MYRALFLWLIIRIIPVKSVQFAAANVINRCSNIDLMQCLLDITDVVVVLILIFILGVPTLLQGLL